MDHASSGFERGGIKPEQKVGAVAPPMPALLYSAPSSFSGSLDCDVLDVFQRFGRDENGHFVWQVFDKRA